MQCLLARHVIRQAEQRNIKTGKATSLSALLHALPRSAQGPCQRLADMEDCLIFSEACQA